MISINATLILQVIHFLLLVFILNRLMFRPILKLINERKEHTEKTRNEINNIELETERLRREFVSRERDARKDAAQERAGQREMGLTSAAELVEDSRKEVTLIRAEADKEVAIEVNKTEPLLRGEAAKLADEITERIIGRRITA